MMLRMVMRTMLVARTMRLVVCVVMMSGMVLVCCLMVGMGRVMSVVRVMAASRHIKLLSQRRRSQAVASSDY